MPISREQFVKRVVKRVRTRFPLVKIVRSPMDSFSLLVNGTIVHLEQLYRASMMNPTDIQYHVDRWVVELLRAAENKPDGESSFKDVADRVFPILLPIEADYPQVEHACSPFVGGLRIAYGLDGDRMITYVSDVLFARWRVSVDEIHEAAIANLETASEELQGDAVLDDDGNISLVVFQTLDGYDASRLLLPSLHERLREHLGSPFIGAIPNRDVLLCFRDDRETVKRMHTQVKKDHRQMPNQITSRLLLVTADGIAARAPRPKAR